MLKIIAFPRIHISLIGMNNDGYRLNGGIGFSMASPTLVMDFEPSGSIQVLDKREHGFTQEELHRLKSHLENIMIREMFDLALCCTIHEGKIQSHVGFGSNSMVYMSCVEALLVINHQEYNENDVITLSGRGGTSGIGINTYFKGGFIFDTGIVNCLQRDLAPSSAFVSESGPKPLTLTAFRLPQWDLGICIPPIVSKTENEESIFFHNNCPIKKEEVEKILYEAVYGVTSALMEDDFDMFCNSIDAIQHTKWKSMERQLYGEELMAVESIIRKAGAKCVGMSSLGPMLYFFGNDIDTIVDQAKKEIPSCVCFKTSFNNYSRVVEYD